MAINLPEIANFSRAKVHRKVSNPDLCVAVHEDPKRHNGGCDNRLRDSMKFSLGRAPQRNESRLRFLGAMLSK
jgi:hypothetical protein